MRVIVPKSYAQIDGLIYYLTVVAYFEYNAVHPYNEIERVERVVLPLKGGLHSSDLFFQGEVESEASSRALGDGYVASMELDGMFYYGEAKAGTAFLAGAAFIYTVEPLKEMGKVSFIEAAAGVLHGDGGIEGGLLGCDGDGAAGWGVLHGVFQQVPNGLRRPDRVSGEGFR